MANETLQASEKIRPHHLSRTAVVYIRQSTSFQVAHNHEGRRRQYGLADLARSMGFAHMNVIDDNLGRSSSGQVERPGFQRLVTAVCTGVVGAVLCLEASRLARNGREWHQLVEMCGLVEAVLIDPEGVYDPRRTNDRLLLGLKGTMSEFELSLLRERSHEAIAAKAKRGEYRVRLPVGLVWGPTGIEFDPDRRVQDALHLVFARRRYESVDPANRLVAADLEARWNDAMRDACAIEVDLRRAQERVQAKPVPDAAELLTLAENLPAVWNDPSTDRRLKQRIVRTLVREVVADVDEQRSDLVLVVHWHGGHHTELRVSKRARSSRHTDLDAIELLRRLAGRFEDRTVASILNRSGARTGAGNTWTVERIQSARAYHGLAVFDDKQTRPTLTITEAARRLGVHHAFVRRLIREGILAATQIVPLAPWEIEADDLQQPAVERAVAAMRRRRFPSRGASDEQTSMFSPTWPGGVQ